MMTPPYAFIPPLKAAWLILKVPIVSISSTVLIPLVVSFEADAKKLPAAPLTKTSSLPKVSTNCFTAALQDLISLTSPLIAITLPVFVRD